MYIKRDLEIVLQDNLFHGKVLVLYGPRQAGKTTLIKHLIEPYNEETLFIDCELSHYKELLERRDAGELFSLMSGYKIVVLDEAQTVRGIGQVLKTLFDHKPAVQFIATGSSSFDLANEVSEPLTGRSREYTLYPLSITELAKNAFGLETILPNFLRFGGYPGIASENEAQKQKDLQLLVSQYLYKNVLSFDGVRKPDSVTALLKLLAFQIGQEVSVRELSNRLNLSAVTVSKYIDLLEKNFVLIRIGSFSRNKRKEVVRSKKIYFVDLGLRNALIDNFAPIQTTARNDVGALFENAMIVERWKYLSHNDCPLATQYFWRTVDQHEVDYIEEQSTKLTAVEFKWNINTSEKISKQFIKLYPDIPVCTITPREGYDFLLGKDDDTK